MKRLGGVTWTLWASCTALGLAAFASLWSTEDLPARLVAVSGQPAASGDRLVRELGCAACHAGVPAALDEVRARSPDLGLAGRTGDAAYVFSALQDSGSTEQGGVSGMPAFHLDERERLALALFLETRNPVDDLRGPSPFTASASRDAATRRAQDRAFARAKRKHRDVNAGMGETMYVALGCVGCHERSPMVEPIGPNLLLVGRLRGGWLRGYLAEPHAVRPFGFRPGSGSRMPDFHLSAEAADSIADFLERNAVERPLAAYTPQTLSAFSRDKAERLLRDRLPCLGCHRMDGEGGKIAPDLSGVGSRLNPDAIYAMIADPQVTVPNTIMPRQLMPPDRVELLANYLVARTEASMTTYLSPLEHPGFTSAADESEGKTLYTRFCAACHGARGTADGFNAPFLPVPPTVHADSAYMATRPDDTLFDGIHAGGYVLNRHHRMPAFGQRLTTSEIRSLVAYMRERCQCAGPAWSRDGRSD